MNLVAPCACQLQAQLATSRCRLDMLSCRWGCMASHDGDLYLPCSTPSLLPRSSPYHAGLRHVRLDLTSPGSHPQSSASPWCPAWQGISQKPALPHDRFQADL